MIWVILSLLCVTSNSATLGTSYLPPPNAKDAGGHEDDLEVPLEPPYVDTYSDNRHLVPEEVRYNFGYGLRSGSPHEIEDDQIRDSSDGFLKYPGRFLHGSCSFEGSDNVIVTVTYTSDRKKPKNKNTRGGGCRRYDENDLEYGGDFKLFGNRVVPTSPGLHREVQRAFSFHRRVFPGGKQNRDHSGKRYKNEEPSEKSIIGPSYSLRNPGPVNHSVNNVQVS